MKKCNTKLNFSLALSLIFCNVLSAQVQVSKEPHHKPVLENKYIRLLDVWINPGDTTLFHIHSTPSLFLHFTTTQVGSQIMGREWQSNRNVAGNASYRSFLNDTLIHRVSNFDTSIFHVTDVELLAAYMPDQPLQPLPFTIAFDNEKAIAYKITQHSMDKRIISGRRPMLAELVKGREVIYYDVKKKKSTTILNGKYLFIAPGSSFYFTAENEDIDLILFEIK
jgi:hypothetical protein